MNEMDLATHMVMVIAIAIAIVISGQTNKERMINTKRSMLMSE